MHEDDNTGQRHLLDANECLVGIEQCRALRAAHEHARWIVRSAHP